MQNSLPESSESRPLRVYPKRGTGTPYLAPASNANPSTREPVPVFGQPLTFRYTVAPGDRERVRAIVESTGFFNPEEVAIAVELVDERLAKGAASGYEFVFADCDGATVGYACFGRVPLTQSSFDLYWIAVRAGQQRSGLGCAILEDVHRQVGKLGGQRIYADTSGREQYAPTRAFYTGMGYVQAAFLPDFFAPGDAKVVFVKPVAAATSTALSESHGSEHSGSGAG